MLRIIKAVTPTELEAVKTIRHEGYREIIDKVSLISDSDRHFLLSEKPSMPETDERYVHLLAISDNIPAGTLAMFIPGEDGKLHSEALWNLEDIKIGKLGEPLKIMVSLKFAGKGITNALMFSVYEIYRYLGYDGAIINAFKGNQYTETLYTKFGFTFMRYEYMEGTPMEIYRILIHEKESDAGYTRYHRYMRRQEQLNADIKTIVESIGGSCSPKYGPPFPF